MSAIWAQGSEPANRERSLRQFTVGQLAIYRAKLARITRKGMRVEVSRMLADVEAELARRDEEHA